MRIAMLYICTGKYTVFWPDFYTSFEEHFLPGCEKTYFVFTDEQALPHGDAQNVRLLPQEALPWPYSTMKRFSMFLRCEQELRGFDFVFFCNANLVCSQTVTPEEFLPRPARGETLLMVQQPGFWDKTPPFFSYDRNPRCTAYIPYNCGRDYVSGGLNGGTGPAFLALCRELDRRTEQDIAAGVIPLWHDESQLNRYIAETDPAHYRLLTPAYWYPEGWTMPFAPKITVRDKSKWLDMTAVKGAKRARPWVEVKWSNFCQNHLPPLYCLRDRLLGRRVPRLR
ncbi:MAG: family 6 glucosyltransferase [Gemmiger sp.]